MLTDFLSKTSQKWRSKLARLRHRLGRRDKRHAREDMMRGEKHSGAMGYIELGFTLADNSVGVGLVQNAAGRFISATQASIAAAYRSVESPFRRISAFRLPTLRATTHTRSSALPGLCPERSTDPERSKALAITSSGRSPRVSKAQRDTGTRRCPRRLPLSSGKSAVTALSASAIPCKARFQPNPGVISLPHRRLSFL